MNIEEKKSLLKAATKKTKEDKAKKALEKKEMRNKKKLDKEQLLEFAEGNDDVVLSEFTINEFNVSRKHLSHLLSKKGTRAAWLQDDLINAYLSSLCTENVFLIPSIIAKKIFDGNLNQYRRVFIKIELYFNFFKLYLILFFYNFIEERFF